MNFAGLQFMFPPAEAERTEAAFDAASSTASADQRRVASLEQYEPMHDALATTSRAAYKIVNLVTAFGVMRAVFEGRLGELT